MTERRSRAYQDRRSALRNMLLSHHDQRGLALVVGGHYWGFAEPSRLVQDVGALLAKRRYVLTPVMSAEQQLPTHGQGRANVCLGAATVAAVEGRQRLNGGESSSHVSPFGSPPPKRGSGVSHLDNI